MHNLERFHHITLQLEDEVIGSNNSNYANYRGTKIFSIRQLCTVIRFFLEGNYEVATHPYVDIMKCKPFE